jgi:hypothetical protein
VRKSQRLVTLDAWRAFMELEFMNASYTFYDDRPRRIPCPQGRTDPAGVADPGRLADSAGLAHPPALNQGDNTWLTRSPATS